MIHSCFCTIVVDDVTIHACMWRYTHSPLVSRCRQWHTDVSTMMFTVRFEFPMYYDQFPFPHPSFFSSWWAVVLSPNQNISHAPCGFIKKRGLDLFTWEIGAFWHVVTPIRLVREVNYDYQTASLQIFGCNDLLC